MARTSCPAPGGRTSGGSRAGRHRFGIEPVEEVVVAATRAAERQGADLGRAVGIHHGIGGEAEEPLEPGADRRVQHLAVGDDPPHRRRALPGAIHGVDDADQDRRRAVQDVRLERQHRFALLGDVGEPGVVDVEPEVFEHEVGRPGVVADGQRDEAAAATLQPWTEQLLLLPDVPRIFGWQPRDALRLAGCPARREVAGLIDRSSEPGSGRLVVEHRQCVEAARGTHEFREPALGVVVQHRLLVGRQPSRVLQPLTHGGARHGRGS